MSNDAVPVELVGVRIELPTNQPIVLLREATGTRYLPIWIGADVATAIAFALSFGLGGREVAGRLLQKEYDRRNRGGPGRPV